jgi:drug/metabolite transporter (DMT)-like permease
LNQFKLWVLIITLSVTVGSSFIAIKIVLDSISPLFAFSIRFMITDGVLILGSYMLDRKIKRLKSSNFGETLWLLVQSFHIILPKKGTLQTEKTCNSYENEIN